MASQGPRSPSSGTTVTIAGGQVWSNPGNITSNNGSVATTSYNGSNENTPSDYLVAKGFGFSIPTGATIDGVLVEVEAAKGSTSSLIPFRARLTKTGTAAVGTTDVLNPSLTTSYAYVSAGDSTSLWGTTLTPAEVNSASFGAFIWVNSFPTLGAGRSVSVDHVRMTVYYTVPDTTAPTISSAPSVSGQPLGSKSYTMVFTATDDVSTGTNALSYTVRTGSGATGGSLVTSGTCTSGTSKSTGTLSDTALAQGNNTRYLRVTDEAGNTQETSYSVVYDGAAPTTSVSPFATINPVGTAQQYAVTFTPSDTVSTGANAISYQIRTATGGGGTLLTNGTSTSGTSKTTSTFTDTGLAQGSNTRYLRLTDEAGNSADYSFSVTYDALAPTVSAGPTPSASVVGTPKHYGVTFTAVDTVSTGLNAITYQIRTAASGGGSMLVSGPATSGNSVLVVSGFITDSSLVQGLNTRYLRLTDEAGNAEDYSFTVTYDGDAPTITVAPTHSPNPVPDTTQYTVTFTATDTISTGADALSYVICTTSGGSGVLQSSTATSGSSKTTATITDSGLIEGSNSRYLRVTDGVGNTVEYPFTVTAVFSVDYVGSGQTSALLQGSGTGKVSSIERALGKILAQGSATGKIAGVERVTQPVLIQTQSSSSLTFNETGRVLSLLAQMAGTSVYTPAGPQDYHQFGEHSTLVQLTASTAVAATERASMSLMLQGAGLSALAMAERRNIPVLVKSGGTAVLLMTEQISTAVLAQSGASAVHEMRGDGAVTLLAQGKGEASVGIYEMIEMPVTAVTQALSQQDMVNTPSDAILVQTADAGSGLLFIETNGIVEILAQLEDVVRVVAGHPVTYDLITFAVTNPYTFTMPQTGGTQTSPYDVVSVTPQRPYVLTIQST